MMKNKEIEEKYLKMIEELNKKHRVKQGQVDNESYHGEWDDLIVEFLKEIGYKKIANRYEKAMEYFWYA